MRSAAASVLGLRVGIPATAFGQMTFSEAAAKVDALGLAFIAGSDSQQFSKEIPKKLDYKLAPGEIEAVRDRLRSLNMRMPIYFASSCGPEVFNFAKTLGVETVVCTSAAESMPGVGAVVETVDALVALKDRPAVLRLRDEKNMTKLVQEMYRS